MKKIHIAVLMTIVNLAALGQGSSAKSTDIPYTIAHGYFVKNTFTKDNYPKGKITTQKRFDTIFGAATVMGANGKPTEINFDTHYAIAVIEKITEANTEINILSLKKTDKKIFCEVEVLTFEKMTSTMRPFSLLIVEKSHKGKVVFQTTKKSGEKIKNQGLPLDSQWIIEFFNQPARDLDSKNCNITLDSKNSSFYGTDGCNRIGGTLKVKGDAITFSEIIGTKRACENMEQGDLFTKNLTEVNRFKIVGGELFLFKDNTLVMTLESFR